MGIAKTMHVVGIYHFYTNDYVAFAKEIGTRFKVNIEVRFEDYTDYESTFEKENEVFDFGFEDTCNVTITTQFYDDHLYPNKFKPYNSYVINLPSPFEDDDNLPLEFWPNGLTQLRYLPFSNKWQFFIDDLQGINDHYYRSHLEVLDNILYIRNVMIDIMRRIDCNEVIIWTDADYKTEDEFVFTHYINRTTTMEELKEAVLLLDGIQLFDFMKLANQEIKIDTTI